MNYHSTGNYANEITSAGGSWNSNGTGLFKNSLDVPNQTQYGMGSQTNHYYCHELDCYISPQNEITGGCVVNGIAFCGIFATGDDGW